MKREKREKIWGTTERVYSVPGIVVDRLEILPGSFCSEHRHAGKTNLFICRAGKIELRWWRPGSEAPESSVLTPGKVGLVMPGIWHQFRSETGAKALEVCFVAEELEESEVDADIERRKEGGRE